MERIDKVISNQVGYSRKEVKELVKKKRVKVDVSINKIFIDDEELIFKKYVYLMLNKPKGYISATEDRSLPTVLDLIDEEYLHRNLFPAGRLDKDTTGLMIITDDGDFAHNILSPKKHVKKSYEVVIDKKMTNEMVLGFRKGIKLIDG